MKYSLVIIAYNEAERLEKLLQSIQGADEVLLIDSNSTDGTVELAQKYGVKVIQQSFLGFGKQKQLGVDSASHDWILSLDADEVPDAAFWNHLNELKKLEPEIKAWYLNRHLIFMGRAFRFGRESRDKQLRFFNRKYARWNDVPVHERVVYDGKTGRLRGSVAHESYSSIENYFEKFNRYTTLAAQKINAENKVRPNWVLALTLPVNFFKFYIIRLNILNGYAGLCWSVFSTVYALVKYSKAAQNNKHVR